jgi:hypothetical protein
MAVIAMILDGEAGTRAQQAAVIRIARQVISNENLEEREHRAATMLTALRTKEKLPI